MKALAEQRLADKIENPVENTWIDYKEIRKQKRRDRMNKIKGQ
jgi:poly-D-alanine transfer protein DltD